MFTTRDVIKALSRANPQQQVTEDNLRNVMRRHRDRAPRPSMFGGRFAWTEADIVALAELMRLQAPSFAAPTVDDEPQPTR